MKVHKLVRTALLALLIMMGAGQALAQFPNPLNIGTLPAGKSITITFEVTVNSPFPTGVTQVCNQGTVSGSNFANVLTDDPDVSGSADPTCTQITNADIGVIAITSPATGCELSNSEMISIEIMNFTSAPQTGFDVSYTVTGPINTGPVTENVGSLVVPGNGTVSFTFSTTANFSTPGNYTVTARTLLTGDANSSNDATTVNISAFPNPTADAGPDKTICPGASVQIGGSPTGSGGTGTLAFSWLPTTGLNNASLANPTAMPASTTTYTVTVTDQNNCTASDQVVVTVQDNQPPVITVNATPITLWPPNHQYQTINVVDCVSSVTDNCGGTIPKSNVIITKVTSDEPENAPGNGDGNTTQDMKIANNCKSVQLRRERQGNGNGRVYTIHLAVRDGNNNIGAAMCLVTVPHDQSGAPAIDDGPVYTVNGACGSGLTLIASNDDELAEASLPEGYALEQNLPNPFNPETEIRFQLPDAVHVVVRIYNTSGQEVRTLVDASYQPGVHSVRWDGKNNHGQPVASGIYLYQLQAGAFSQVRKMSLLR